MIKQLRIILDENQEYKFTGCETSLGSGACFIDRTTKRLSARIREVGFLMDQKRPSEVV